MDAELVIQGGTVIDGSGSPGVRADVAISDGRIVAIGEGLTGQRVLDAAGCVVAPGFIDIHTHYDAQVFWDGALTPSCFHGVTTVVAGNCGFSIAPTRPEHRELIARTLENVEDMDVDALREGVPWDFETFDEYLGSVAAGGTALNFGAYIGHSALRLYVMGDDGYDRAATPTEIDEMRAIVGKAMAAGAMGFATSASPTHLGAGGKPVPSRTAETEELVALLGAVSDSGKGLVAMVPGMTVPPASIYEWQRDMDVPITYGALLANANGIHDYLLEVHRDGWEAGARVYPQVTPRPLGLSFPVTEPFPWNANPHFSALMGSTVAERAKAYGDPQWRADVREVWDAQGSVFPPRWETYDIAESGAHPELVGRRVAEVADERGVHPFDLLLDLALEEDDLALRVYGILANDDVEVVGRLLTEPNCVFGLSDAGAHVSQLCDAPQATDLLSKWVRERGTMPIEEAVRRLTSAQAELLGLPERGTIRPGYWADLVVFDPETVGTGPLRRVNDFPADSERLTADAPTGVRHVLVNGEPIRVDGEQLLEARPGAMVAPATRTA